MESNQKAGTIELDQTQLLGIDQAPNQPLPETTLVARVGEKLLIGFAAKVGSKPSNATKDAGLANLTKVGFKDNLRRWRKDRAAPLSPAPSRPAPCPTDRLTHACIAPRIRLN